MSTILGNAKLLKQADDLFHEVARLKGTITKLRLELAEEHIYGADQWTRAEKFRDTIEELTDELALVTIERDNLRGTVIKYATALSVVMNEHYDGSVLSQENEDE